MLPIAPGRLEKQLAFIIECDRLKSVLRKTSLMHDSRRENSAEHSWTLSLMAMVLSEYAAVKVDVFKTMKMCLIHDLVEVYCGDVFIYDTNGREAQKEKEKVAAEKLFSLLPEDQKEEFKSLWEEFEEHTTAESKFAATLDRLQPIIANYLNGGGTWKQHDIHKDQVYERASHIERTSPEIWKAVTAIIEEAHKQGFVRGG